MLAADTSGLLTIVRDCAIIIRRGAEKLELSSKNLDSTPPPKQKKLVLTPHPPHPHHPLKS